MLLPAAMAFWGIAVDLLHGPLKLFSLQARLWLQMGVHASSGRALALPGLPAEAGTCCESCRHIGRYSPDLGVTVMQGKAWLRQRPHVVAIIALALLGSAGLVSTFGGPLRRSALGKHKRLMAQGIPESLMRVNITATYADNFCKSSAPSNLTTQHWMDGPICQRGNSTLKARQAGWHVAPS